MHDAYETLPVLERLPLMIESIACYGESNTKIQASEGDPSFQRRSKNKITLLVGTKPGHLLVYKVQREIRRTGSHIDVTLEKSNRSFSKRPIQQLFVSAELKILISLSDGSVTVHDLFSFQIITTLQKAKGATLFAADLEEQISSTGEVAYELKLCVVVKRKLQFYFWKNRDFAELHADIVIPEAAKCLSWCRDTVCLGFKKEYMLAKLTDAEPLQELFPTGKLMEPVLGRLDSEQLVVMKDDNSVFIDCNGAPTYQQSFPWSEAPTYLESQPPFLLAILPKYVEVRTVDPKSLIQSIEVQRARSLSCWSDWMFVSSSTHIWLLQQRPISVQVDQLLRDREFELALKLAKMSTDQDESEKLKQIRQIRTSLAFELFCQRRFAESLRIFADLETDPVQVIGLYPDLLPASYQNKLNYPSTPPSISHDDMEDALNALIELLTDKRKLAQKADAYIENTFPVVEGNATVRSKRQLLQIIDTTLLKCYLKTNDALVAPLLRLPDNHCHVEEAERELRKAGKNRELIELYKSKSLHRRALNLLLEQTESQNKAEAREDMIEYLQHLGQEHIELIFDFAPGLLKADPVNAMKIFTADVAEVESLPKHRVYDFLDSISPSLLLAYLEHVIFNLNENLPEFHNRLAIAYRDRVLGLMREFHDSLPEDERSSDLSNAPLDLRETRQKLRFFLEYSTFYEPDRILHGIPPNKLVEERALLLGRQGLHQQALALYANTLKNNRLAEEFCQKVYQQNPTQENEIFLSLLKLYLEPPTFSPDSSMTDEVEPASVEHALEILHRHAGKVDAQKAIKLLPPSTNVASVSEFLAAVLENLVERLHRAQVLKSLLLSESLQVHEQRIFHESQKCVIKEERVCKVCRKKIGVSAFARYPGDVIVHYYCCKDRKVAPPSG